MLRYRTTLKTDIHIRWTKTGFSFSDVIQFLLEWQYIRSTYVQTEYIRIKIKLEKNTMLAGSQIYMWQTRVVWTVNRGLSLLDSMDWHHNAVKVLSSFWCHMSSQLYELYWWFLKILNYYIFEWTIDNMLNCQWYFLLKIDCFFKYMLMLISIAIY